MKRKRLISGALLLSTALVLGGCQATTTGSVKKDTSVTGQTDKLEEAGSKYNGPRYTVGIITFSNRTPGKVLGIGEAATDILRTMLKQAGLEPVMLTKDELKQHDEMIALQQSGVVKTGKKDAAGGMDSIDFRVSGAITSYSELEEGSDILISQSKTQIARVGVDYALVDIASGRTLVAKSGMGEYRKKTGGVLGFGSASTADVGLRDGALRDALAKAMEAMVLQLGSRPFQSKIMLVDGQTVIFRGGNNSKLEAGSKLGVYRPGKELIDPDTGRSLGQRESKIGEVMLTAHQNDNVSEGTVSSGMGFKRGDVLKAIP